MRKFIAVALSVMLAGSLVACGGGGAASTAESSAAASSAASSAEEKSEAPASSAAETSSAAEATESTDKVVIGVFGAVTGVNSESGRQAIMAAEAGQWYINEVLGGIESLGGAQVECRVIDSTSDASTASLPFEQALSQGDICAVAGSCQSAIALTQLPILQKYQIPAVLGSAANGTITEQGCEFVFQIAPIMSAFAKIKLEFLEYYAELKGINIEDLKFGIVYENSAWGTDGAESSRKLCAERNLNIVYDENYEAGSLTDATSLVTKMKNAGVDVLFPGCYANDAKLIMTACAAMDYMPIVFGDGSAFTWPSLQKDLGEMVNGIISADGFCNDSIGCRENPEWQKINDHYEEVNGEFIPGQAGPTIASIMMIYQAIEELGSTDSVAIRDKLRTFNGDNCEWLNIYNGVQEFNENGLNAGAGPIMLQWQNEKPTCVYPLEAAANPVLDAKTLEPLA